MVIVVQPLLTVVHPLLILRYNPSKKLKLLEVFDAVRDDPDSGSKVEAFERHPGSLNVPYTTVYPWAEPSKRARTWRAPSLHTPPFTPLPSHPSLLNSRLQASFLSDEWWVQDMSRKVDGPAHVAALDLAVAQQRGTAPPPTGPDALEIHRASRAAWASHLHWSQYFDSFSDDGDRSGNMIFGSYGLRCCPLCDEESGPPRQNPLRVGYVLENDTCWCHGTCQHPPSPGSCTTGCQGPCACELSLAAGQTVWYCDSCTDARAAEISGRYIVCSSCMGFGDDPFGHMARVEALDSVSDAARIARHAFGFDT